MCKIGTDDNGNDIIVQRDMYSSLLLKCMQTPNQISREACINSFNGWYHLQNEFIEDTKRKKLKIYNSGFGDKIVDLTKSIDIC